MRRRVLWALLRWLPAVLVVYVQVSLLGYALRHPAATQTSVLLHIVDAMLWR